MMTNDTLKPCPWCGSKPYIIEDNSYGDCCIGCTCEVEPCVYRPKWKLDEAIKAWNTQALDKETIEVLRPFAHPDLHKLFSNNVEGDESIVFQRDKAVLIISDLRKAAELYVKLKEKK